jgi:hypothetical protein
MLAGALRTTPTRKAAGAVGASKSSRGGPPKRTAPIEISASDAADDASGQMPAFT